MKVIGVRFKSSGRIYYFDPLEFTFQEGDGVIVETARGQEYGEVAQVAMEVEETMIVSPLKPVVRPASDQDTTMREQNCAKEGDAFRVCQQKIEQHKLDMRLVSAEYSFNGSKLVFYFTADERVDFRDLVKDLASQFRTRIELRQIGVRDEAKMLGGLGSCGRVVCCKAFLDDFHPVSIKMAKEQNLSLSPTKISGLCGRLMCCLQYEQACYEDMRHKMPHVNRDILTPDGIGFVVENNVITEKTKVRLNMPDGSIDVREYHYTSLAKPGEPLPVPPNPPAAAANTPNMPNAPKPEREAIAAATPASNGAQGAAQPAQDRNPDRKRRRRGGRGKSGNHQNAGTAPANGAPAQPNGNANNSNNANQKPRAEGQQQQQNRPPRPPQQPANGGMPPQTQRVGGASGPARPNNPHRRDNPNRPRPNKPAPEKQES